MATTNVTFEPPSGGIAPSNPTPAYKPARDLTDEEALAVLGLTKADLNANGRLDLKPMVEGVEFQYCGGGKCAPSTTRNLSPKFVVFLHRFASFLKDTFDAVSVQHAGMWPAGKGQISHDAGIALDFDGITTADGTVYSVLNDWGMKPKSGSGYRLHSGDKGYDFFQAVYDFTGKEGDDRYDGSQTILGQEDSFIRHPDLHDPQAAALHKDHMHLQAGQIKSGKGVVSIGSPGSSGSSASSSLPTGSVPLIIGAGLLGLWFIVKD
jgi:hypothetical protein